MLTCPMLFFFLGSFRPVFLGRHYRHLRKVLMETMRDCWKLQSLREVRWQISKAEGRKKCEPPLVVWEMQLKVHSSAVIGGVSSL